MYKRFGGISIHVGEFCDRSAAYIVQYIMHKSETRKTFLVYYSYVVNVLRTVPD